jgi:hypothetical protein
MIRSSWHLFFSLAALLWLACPSAAQQRKQAYDLFPDSAAAVVWVADGDRLAQQWERTQLYFLAKDSAFSPFFEEQRQAIEQRLIDAGWRLNVKPDDLANFTTGQIGLAWLELPQSTRKPFALALIADVDDAKVPNAQLLAKIEAELVARKATKALLSHQGVEIAKFTLPRRAGALLPEDGYYAIASGQFLSTDDESLMKDLISRIQGENVVGKVIAQDPDFIAGRQKAEITGEGQVEYFVRPLGIARVLRAIGGKRSRSNADMLAVLQNQGFEAIKCVCGEVAIGLDDLDFSHHGYVLAERPLPKSAAMLDFPNKASHEIPSFVGENISSLLATNWNAREAFWKVEGLVDELAGTPGVFHEVIEGIKVDPNGPRIDIEKEVLPHITNDIYSISDSKPGAADVDSRRNLIALRLINAAAMAKVLDRAMKNEPDAEPVEYKGHLIWKVVHREDEEVTDLAADFGGGFGGPPPTAADQPQPWLSNWAITVYGDFLMFASHAEMIEQAIEQAQTSNESPLVSESDYRRVAKAIAERFGGDDISAWQVVRTSIAYRVQYELFREGKLMDSQSMLASILDRLLQNEDEMRGKAQALDGKKLPPYDEVAKFLQPMGTVVRSTDSGWDFGAVMLSGKGAPTTPDATLGKQASQGTARVSNSPAEAKR